MTPKEVLIAARKVIEKPENWTREVYARTQDGQSVQPTAPAACRWCAVGAIARIAGGVRNELACEAEALLETGVPWDQEIVGLNDTRPHAEVLAAFDKAIAEAA